MPSRQCFGDFQTLFLAMKSLKEFLYSFWENSGHLVFLSLLISKICAFITSLILIRWMPVGEFGSITLVFSIFSLFAPFSGLGSSQSLLRFGSIKNKTEDQYRLSAYLFKQGFVYHIGISVLFLAISIFYIQKIEDAFYIFLFFFIRLIGIFFHNHLQSEQRIIGNNRIFANINNAVNLGGLLLTAVLTYLFQLYGYLVAMAIAPFLSMFWLKFSTLKKHTDFNFNKKEIWNYALHSSGTAVLSDALFALDILILGWLMSEQGVAHYKVAIILPANITFLSLVFMQSDFPKLAKNYDNRTFLKNYIFNYYKLFLPLCLFIFGIVLWLKKDIIQLLFGEEYLDSSTSFVVLFAAFLINILLRNLYGNLLSAVGKMKANTAVSVFALMVLSSFSFFLVNDYGIFGMAVAQSLTLFSTGILMGWQFWNYFKKLK